jgi:hypothetical protein
MTKKNAKMPNRHFCSDDSPRFVDESGLLSWGIVSVTVYLHALRWTR